MAQKSGRLSETQEEFRRHPCKASENISLDILNIHVDILSGLHVIRKISKSLFTESRHALMPDCFKSGEPSEKHNEMQNLECVDTAHN